MIQKCPVLLNNEAVTVIKYDNVEVQVPSIERDAQYVNVSFENGKYTVVEDNYIEEPIVLEEPVVKNSKKKNKKTTIEYNAIAEDAFAEIDELG